MLALGKVQALAIRTAKNGPMKELQQTLAIAGRGLKGDINCREDRQISLISQQQWNTVQQELSAELPWHTRRANVLVDAPHLGDLIGKTISVGPVRIEVTMETKPCSLMDQLHEGLKGALTPEFRGGILGRVLNDGTIKIGDELTVSL